MIVRPVKGWLEQFIRLRPQAVHNEGRDNAVDFEILRDGITGARVVIGHVAMSKCPTVLLQAYPSHFDRLLLRLISVDGEFNILSERCKSVTNLTEQHLLNSGKHVKIIVVAQLVLRFISTYLPSNYED